MTREDWKGGSMTSPQTELLKTAVDIVLRAKGIASGGGPPRAYVETTGLQGKRFTYLTYAMGGASAEAVILAAILHFNATLTACKTLLWRTEPTLETCDDGQWRVYCRYAQLDDDSISINVRWNI